MIDWEVIYKLKYPPPPKKKKTYTQKCYATLIEIKAWQCHVCFILFCHCNNQARTHEIKSLSIKTVFAYKTMVSRECLTFFGQYEC